MSTNNCNFFLELLLIIQKKLKKSICTYLHVYIYTQIEQHVHNIYDDRQPYTCMNKLDCGNDHNDNNIKVFVMSLSLNLSASMFPIVTLTLSIFGLGVS